jgi:hypothetical protein
MPYTDNTQSTVQARVLRLPTIVNIELVTRVEPLRSCEKRDQASGQGSN